MRLLPGTAERLANRLLRLNSLQVIVLFVFLAVLFSEMIVLVIDLSWDGRLNSELQFAGFLTPLIDGLIIVSLLVLLLSALRGEAKKRAETERSLKEAQRIAHIGNWHYDPGQDRLTWSDEIYRILEITPGNFPASYEAFLEVVHPEDRDEVAHSFSYSQEHRQPYEITHRLLMADGRVKYVHVRGERQYGAGGAPLGTVGTVQDVTERVLLEQELVRLATIDALTGIFNRHRFNQGLAHELTTASRYGAALTLLMFDIDNFKEVNDQDGHEKGDRLLRHVVRMAQGSLRKSDIFARWGGDEFMILSPHTGMQEADRLAERLRARVEQECFQGRSVTISLGLTEYLPGESSLALLKRVDKALYEAKQAGRNCVVSKPRVQGAGA
ncbi:MAG TPA: diguanylate cyclase [Gammaproteobacteria bacterium]|jgi:diguanylate cyclase (GGDEF)-like protein